MKELKLGEIHIIFHDHGEEKTKVESIEQQPFPEAPFVSPDELELNEDDKYMLKEMEKNRMLLEDPLGYEQGIIDEQLGEGRETLQN